MQLFEEHIEEFEVGTRKWLELQKERDEDDFKTYDIKDGYRSPDLNYESRMLNAVGEINKDFKQLWCWYDSREDEDTKDKTAVDWHFVEACSIMLSYTLSKHNGDIDAALKDCTKAYKWANSRGDDRAPLAEILIEWAGYMELSTMFRAMMKIGYSWDEVCNWAIGYM